MFKIPTVGEVSKRLVQNCRFARIPLIRTECVYNSSPINRLILNFNQSLEPKLIPTKNVPKTKRSAKCKGKRRTQYSMKPLSDYSTSIPTKQPEKKTKPIVPKSLTRNLEYITTDNFKRISPELYELIQDENSNNTKNENKPSSASCKTSLDDKPDWAYHNPNLYKYLRQVIDSDNPLNLYYGIDYENNFDPEELEIFKLVDPAIAEDMLRAMQLFKLLLSGATLTPDQLQFLAQFLRNLVHFGAETFDLFMSLMKIGGVNIDKVGLYMQKLYKELRFQLSPSELKLLEDKLNRPEFGLFSVLSSLDKDKDAKISHLQYRGQTEENINRRPSKKLNDQKNFKKRKSVVLKPEEDDFKPSNLPRSDDEDKNYLKSSNLPRSDDKAKNYLKSSNLPRSDDKDKDKDKDKDGLKKLPSQNDLKMPKHNSEGFFRPWDVKINWQEKPKFYRYSTAVRRSTHY